MADEKPDLRKATLSELAAEADERARREHMRRAGIVESRSAPRRRSYSSPSYSPSRRGGGVGEAVGDVLYAVFIGWWAD